MLAVLLALSLQADTVLVAGQSNAVLLEPFLSSPRIVIGASGAPIRAFGPQTPMGIAADAALATKRIRALVYWQGESDSTTPDYRVRLRALLIRWRTAAQNPTLPIILVRVLNLPTLRAIREAQEAFVNNDAHAILISTDGYQLRDEAHLTTEGYRVVAARVEAALKR